MKRRWTYEVQADDGDREPAGSFWEAYWRADELRGAGAQVVRVFPTGRTSPVFALTRRTATMPEDRASNTVDPGMWDAVLEMTKGKRQ